MTLILTSFAFLAAVSLLLGLYFRIAEYDVLASDQVWERIAPASLAIVNDERVPDEIAAVVAAFSMMTGCGCFVNSVLADTFKAKFGITARSADAAGLSKKIASLDDETKHLLANLLQDLLIFDTLHAPLLGRLCRVLNRSQFSRAKYRPKNLDPDSEQAVIIRLTYAAELTIERKNGERQVPSLVAA